MSPKPIPELKRRSRKALATRMLIAQSNWLDAPMRWERGCIVWEYEGRQLEADSHLLARTQRMLNEALKDLPGAAKILANPEAWQSKRKQQLDLAKRLRQIQCSDISVLIKSCRSGNESALKHLCALLIAEALCINQIEPSPAKAVSALGQLASPSLLSLINDQTLPKEVHCLAALVLGASQARSPLKVQTGILKKDETVRGAYNFGLEHGCPDTPALIACLCSQKDGARYIPQYLEVTRRTASFQVHPDVLKQLIRKDRTTEEIATLAIAAQGLDEIFAELRRYRVDLPQKLPKKGNPRAQALLMREAAEKLETQRLTAISSLTRLINDYILATADPLVVLCTGTIAKALMQLSQDNGEIVAFLTKILDTGRRLPPKQRLGFVKIIATEHGQIWDKEKARENNKDAATKWSCSNELERLSDLVSLLETFKDVDLVRALVHHGIDCAAKKSGCRSLEQCRAVLRCTRELAINGNWEIGALFDYFRGVRETTDVYRLLSPAIDAVKSAGTMSEHYATILVQCLTYGSKTKLAKAEGASLLLPLLIASRASKFEACPCYELMSIGFDLLNRDASTACQWFTWLVNFAEEQNKRRSFCGLDIRALSHAGSVAAAVAADLSQYQSICRSLFGARLERQNPWIDRGISLLSRYPFVHHTIAMIASQQPKRCQRFLVQAGLATNLPNALNDIARIDPSKIKEPVLDDHWQEIQRLCPEAKPLIDTYFCAMDYLEHPPVVPKTVQKVLHLPKRLSDELSFLRRLVSPEMNDAKTTRRVHNLEQQLANQSHILASQRKEIFKHMQQAACERHMEALEMLILNQYRRRLNEIAGPVPPDVELDSSLLNAALLSLDIKANRRLLRRMLRHHFTANHRWCLDHPANKEFLSELETRGIPSDIWLGQNARLYRTKKLPGGFVRLYMETNPLNILEMGNYFDTCLSFGNPNSFSTVANAIDVNKRVIYATDYKGRVIGRKLIALNTNLELVGFYTYKNVADERAANVLEDIFHRYCLDLARKCRLALSEQGEVARLMAQDWYDDGIVAWSARSSSKPMTNSFHKRKNTHSKD